MDRKKVPTKFNFGETGHDPMVDNDATLNILDGVDLDQLESFEKDPCTMLIHNIGSNKETDNSD